VSLFKSASTVSLLTLASRITGLVRDVLFASVFGVSALTDAFNVAFRIPNLFRRVFGEGAFSQAFVPVLAARKTEAGQEGARELVDHVATLLTWALVVLCVAGVAGAPLLVWAMASGLQGFDAAVVMTRWMFPYIGFMSLVALAGGILNTWRKFAVPAASPVLLNIALILSISIGAPLFRRYGIEPIYAQCVGVMVGGVLQLALQIPALRALGLMPRIGASFKALRAAWTDPTTRKVMKLMLPALLGVSVAQISLLAGARAAKDDARYSSLLDWGLRLVVLLAAPCAVALLLFAKPLVAVLFHNGAYTGEDVGRTTVALMGYGVGLVGLVAVKVLAPGYYAKHDTRTPMLIAVTVLVFTQVLNFFLVPLLQHAALTLTIGIGALVNALWLLIGLIRRGSYTPEPGWGKFALQVLLGTVVLAVLLAWGAHYFDWVGLRAQRLHRIGLLAALIAGAALLYFAVLTAAGVRLRSFMRR